MNRAALEPILRPVSAIIERARVRRHRESGDPRFHASTPGSAPQRLLVSIQADVYPRHSPGRSDLIDGAIGELSAFHQAFGYYVHRVDETTAILPDGWMDRLVPNENENTGGAIGWCLEAHDLAISKLVAGREQDVRFVRALLKEGMVDSVVLVEHLETLPLPSDRIRPVRVLLSRLTAGP